MRKKVETCFDAGVDSMCVCARARARVLVYVCVCLHFQGRQLMDKIPTATPFSIRPARF
jgi:hypothetical protein